MVGWRAKLRYADLSRVNNLTDANLSYAGMIGARLVGTELLSHRDGTSFGVGAHNARDRSTVGGQLALRPEFSARVRMPPTARSAPRGGRRGLLVLTAGPVGALPRALPQRPARAGRRRPPASAHAPSLVLLRGIAEYHSLVLPRGRGLSLAGAFAWWRGAVVAVVQSRGDDGGVVVQPLGGCGGVGVVGCCWALPVAEC
jgi:uncharacterized protein YjbI with pentapeptide repeats